MSEECTRFESSLLELAYDELSPALAEELRLHAASCPRCRKALEEVMLTRRLAARLEPEELGDEIDGAILGAASEAAEMFSSPTAVADPLSERSPAPPPTSLRRAPSIVDRLRSWMLTPALATAAAATLVFAFTFFLIDKGSSPEESFEMAARAPVVAPGRLADRVAEDKKVAEAHLAAARAEKKALAGTRARTETEDGAAKIAAKTNLSRTAAGNLGTAGPASVKTDTKSRKRTKMLRGAGREDQLEGIELDRAPAPELKAEPAPRASAFGAEPAAPQAVDSSGDGADYRLGMAAFDRGDCKSATAAFKRVVDAEGNRTPQAMHHIARCQKRGGRFGGALPWYDKLLNRYPRYPSRAEALLEAATCHRRLGHMTKARARLDELSRIPGWKERAEQEAARLSD